MVRYAEQARRHPDGIVDLSVGTPVDPTPEVVQQALRAAADSPGYPLTIGRPETRQAALDWLERKHGVTGLGLDQVLPVIGSKELIGSMAVHLGIGAGDLIAYPELAYPTYEVGAALAGARAVATDSLTSFGPEAPKLLWLNSPSNPTGRVLPVEHLRKVVAWGRERGVVIASDECYLSLSWDATPVSILSDEVCDGDYSGLLAVHSLSKSSSLAGYRAGFVTGDPELIAGLLELRKHAGMIVPRPVQEAMRAALEDDAHVAEQRSRYLARREVLKPALEAAGFTVSHSEAGLYLWSSRGEDAWETISWLADRGILAAPGTFYGPAGAQHVRVALTATDERVAAAAERPTA